MSVNVASGVISKRSFGIIWYSTEKKRILDVDKILIQRTYEYRKGVDNQSGPTTEFTCLSFSFSDEPQMQITESIAGYENEIVCRHIADKLSQILNVEVSEISEERTLN
ncbi:hypothetical protein OAE80_03755 [Planctomycetaceae bacterium]|nr:hypothetical protein [Planctomycetaceae bacterium]